MGISLKELLKESINNNIENKFVINFKREKVINKIKNVIQNGKN